MAGWRGRIVGILRAGGRHVLAGLTHLGFNTGTIVHLGPSGLPQVSPVPRLPLDRPPLAHPERLVPHVPPTDIERALWADLGWTTGRA
jgi:hypothetical protein